MKGTKAGIEHGRHGGDTEGHGNEDKGFSAMGVNPNESMLAFIDIPTLLPRFRDLLVPSPPQWR